MRTGSAMRPVGMAGRRGVSLLELLLVMVVASILLLVVVTLWKVTAGQWEDSRLKAGMRRDARMLMHMLRTDMAAMARDLPAEFGEPSIDGEGFHEVAFYRYRDPVDPFSQTRGDVVFVRYYPAFRVDVGGRLGRHVFRRELSRAASLELLRSGESDDSRDPASDDIIAFHVLDIEMQAVGRDEEGRWGRVETLGEATQLELAFRLLQAPAAARMQTESDWLGETPLARQHFGAFGGDAADRSAETFYSVIPLP